MKYLEQVKKALQEVYKRKKYFLVTLVFAFLIVMFNLLVNNYRLILSQPSLIPILMLGSFGTISKTAFSLLLVSALLGGMVFSMGIFLVARQIGGTVGASSSVLLSVIAPSCPACAIGPLSVLGLSGYLAVLPFQGLELGILSIIILSVSLVYLSGKIETKVCKTR